MLCFHRHAADYAKEHEEASQDVQGYLSNPINAYLLVKRLTTDWKEVETQMVDDVGKGIIHQNVVFEMSIANNSVM
jgi:prolyl 4-hydroxylase